MHPPSVDALARSLTDVELPPPLLVDAAREAIAAGDPDSARAWMQLKLLLALVTEKLCYDARFFSPWGYRLEFQPLGGVAGNDRLGVDEPALPAAFT